MFQCENFAGIFFFLSYFLYINFVFYVYLILLIYFFIMIECVSEKLNACFQLHIPDVNFLFVKKKNNTFHINKTSKL